MQAEQRRLGEGGVVMEGRDIGSVVFADAPVKIYLSAGAAERERRARERADGGDRGRARALHERDDVTCRSTRSSAAEGAAVIDTTDLDVERTVEAALDVVRAGARSCSRERRSPRIAVVGRQNVGKSTLVNRLFGRRETSPMDSRASRAIASSSRATWRGRRFGLVDTAGLRQRGARPRGGGAEAGRAGDRARRT